MSEPLVSIVIPTYNRASLIGQSLKSALAQTYKNCEIIVVDDGSTDNTRQVVESFGPAVRYISKDNSGPSPTRNLGIREAKGEYVAFLDSDDLWEPTKIEKQLRCFEQNPDRGMVSCNYRFIDQNNAVIKDPGAYPGYVPAPYLINDMVRLQFPFAATSQFMFRRSIFEKIGAFKENLRISEDVDLLIRVGVKFPIGYVDEVLVSVRLHENHSMRETPRHEIWLNSVRVYQSHADEIRQIVPKPERFFANFYALAGNSALLSSKRIIALGLHWKAVCLAPTRLKGYKDCVRCFLPMGYLKSRYEKSLKIKMPEKLKKYQ